MLRYCLYVSRSRLPQAGAMEEVHRLVAEARAYNRRRSLSGTLIFSGNCFAQYLEGPEQSFTSLFESIRRDSRHDEFLVLMEGCREEREFPRRPLQYSGPSLFVDRHISQFFDKLRAGPRGLATGLLLQIMKGTTQAIAEGRRLAPRGECSKPDFDPSRPGWPA